MTYRVFLQRAVSEEATIEVDADSKEKAEDVALQRADDDFVAWTRVSGDTEARAVRSQ